MLRLLRPGGLLVVEHDWLYGLVRQVRTGFPSMYSPAELRQVRTVRLARLGISAPGLPTLSVLSPRLARHLSRWFIRAPLNRLATFVIVAYRTL
jgi:hypothetical protein